MGIILVAFLAPTGLSNTPCAELLTIIPAVVFILLTRTSVSHDTQGLLVVQPTLEQCQLVCDCFYRLFINHLSRAFYRNFRHCQLSERVRIPHSVSFISLPASVVSVVFLKPHRPYAELLLSLRQNDKQRREEYGTGQV